MIILKIMVFLGHFGTSWDTNYHPTPKVVMFEKIILSSANQDQMKHKELTHRIIGCAMRVHSTLGNGFPEVIYQRAMEIELRINGLRAERESAMPVYYRDQHIGTRRVDFFVENLILVELKAVIRLEDVHLAQAMNYVEAFEKEVGLLINFGARSLQYKRVHNNNQDLDFGP